VSASASACVAASLVGSPSALRALAGKSNAFSIVSRSARKSGAVTRSVQLPRVPSVPPPGAGIPDASLHEITVPSRLCPISQTCGRSTDSFSR
jgi:hypothetical protein